MRLGVLDVGSNSAQLQIVEAHPGAPPLPAHAVKEPTRLGEAFEADGSINDAGVDRVIGAVEQAVAAARWFAVEQLYAFVTSAVRDATNRDQIIAQVHQRVGVRPQFLTGEDEAQLTYLAVRGWYGWSVGRLLVLDIGGGSMEVALGRDGEPEVAVSLPLGAGRMTREFLPDDSASGKQLKALRRHVRATLREVSDRLHWEGSPATVAATSKTVKQLARLAGAAPQRKGPFVPRALTANALDRLVPRLAGMTTRQRAALRGVSKPRARQIVAGAVVAQETMRALAISSTQVCPWALREGVMLHHLQARLDHRRSQPLCPVTLVPDHPAATGAPMQALPHRSDQPAG